METVRVDSGWTGFQGKQNLLLGMGLCGRAELSQRRRQAFQVKKQKDPRLGGGPHY